MRGATATHELWPTRSGIKAGFIELAQALPRRPVLEAMYELYERRCMN